MPIARTLDERIQALAQELQDIIFDCTVAFEPGVVLVDKECKASWQLQINRATRAKLTKANYNQSTFRIIMARDDQITFKPASDDGEISCRYGVEESDSGNRARLKAIAQYSTRLCFLCIHEIKARSLVYEGDGKLKEVWRSAWDWPAFTVPPWASPSWIWTPKVGDARDYPFAQ
ncbi:hypothetical protein AC579_4660 [Pseudocercospora musae]|uniref:Uncharacterized protein n=1 Tax=Pseudocercospora musae TaxID=113226 RepID=A0A139IBF5_9PEZI|nr:hypothetical protein AC579_4660 [Pseudocercospora musae]